MSNRLLKRANKERTVERTSAADEEEEAEGEDEDEDCGSIAKNRTKNSFQFLMMSDDDEEEEEEEEEIKETVKSDSKTMATKKQKKKKKKKKNVEEDEITKALKDIGCDDEDDDDFVLLGIDGLRLDGNGSSTNSEQRRRYDELLECDVRKLKAEDELKKKFSFVAGDNRTTTTASTASSMFAYSKPNWAKQSRAIGLSMVKVARLDEKYRMDLAYEEGECFSSSYYAFSTGVAYQDANELFQQARETHDPRAITHLLRKYPLHAESLLAVSDVHYVVGDADKASDSIEQCLAAFEKSFHRDFIGDVKKGIARIPINPPQTILVDIEYNDDDDDDDGIFDVTDAILERKDNLEAHIAEWDDSREKTFFKALFKHVCGLCRRGTYEAALEASKMMISLEPKDYFCAGFIIDYVALRCESESKLLWLEEFLSSVLRRNNSPFDLWYRPNFAYSYALCLKLQNNKQNESDAALREAISQHPLALFALINKLELQARDVEWLEIISKSEYFTNTCVNDKDGQKNASYEFACKIFQERHHLIWRSDRILSWAKSIAKNVCDEYVNLNALLKAGTEEEGEIYASLNPITWEATRKQILSTSFASKTKKNENVLFAHVFIEDFQDVVKRQLPEDEANPFLAPNNPRQQQQQQQQQQQRHQNNDEFDREQRRLIADVMNRGGFENIAEAELEQIANLHARNNNVNNIGALRAFFATLFHGDANNGDFVDNRLRNIIRRREPEEEPEEEEDHEN